MSDEAMRERLRKWRDDNHRIDYMDDVDVCEWTASEVARDQAALAAGERSAEHAVAKLRAKGNRT